MGYYTIGTKLGYDLANGLQPGQSITATDGSVWTKNQDGTISVLQDGQKKVGQITYQPDPVQTPAAPAGKTGYQSPYTQQLNDALAGLGQSQWQGWNKDEDESYQAYRKQYLREAERTERDVLGQYAQNTGGIAGSSAINAASQASDYYKAQLADKVPELYENAYSRYLNDMQLQQQNINTLMAAESQNADLYYQQLNYAMQKWAQMGYADAEVSGILGVAQGTPTSDQSYTDWSKAFEERSYGGGGSYSDTGAGTEGSEEGSYGYDDMFYAAYSSGQPELWAEMHAKEFGFSAETFMDSYDQWVENGGPQGMGNEEQEQLVDGVTEASIDDWVKTMLNTRGTEALNRSAMQRWVNAQYKTAAQRETAMAVWEYRVNAGYGAGFAE